MQSFCGKLGLLHAQSSSLSPFKASRALLVTSYSSYGFSGVGRGSSNSIPGSSAPVGVSAAELTANIMGSSKNYLLSLLRETKTDFSRKASMSSSTFSGSPMSCLSRRAPVLPPFSGRWMKTNREAAQDSSASVTDVAPQIKFKRLDKTARHIMQIIDKEAVGEVKAQREIPEIKPGYIVQLKVEVPQNKRRVSLVKGIVIARRNAGLNTTIRIRRLVAGVGVESLYPLYSPNLKEIKVLDKKKVRRAKLYYLRDKMNALKK
ncbi:hypothetical protein SLE2022_376590 [Rubroshorea leprosula]